MPYIGPRCILKIFNDTVIYSLDTQHKSHIEILGPSTSLHYQSRMESSIKG